MIKKAANDASQLTMLFADVQKDGNGGFYVRPRKPVREVGPHEAARILNCSRANLSRIVNLPLGSMLIRWRWTSERQGKRLFDVESLMAYRKAMEDPEPVLQLNGRQERGVHAAST